MKSLKIVLIGYGRMGQEIEKAAKMRGHSILFSVDKDDQDKLTTENLKQADVAIEFSIPEAAFDNIMACFKAGVPVVSGTTGWLDNFYEIRKYCIEHKNAFFYASNFSIGVNLFFQANKYLARIMNSYPNYDVSIEEVHHKHKLDAPSGTAINLADILIETLNQKESWILGDNASSSEIAIEAKREGDVKGIHEVIHDSEIDFIKLKHSAKSRKGFAQGAVMAAEFLKDKTGVYTMNDLLGL